MNDEFEPLATSEGRLATLSLIHSAEARIAELNKANDERIAPMIEQVIAITARTKEIVDKLESNLFRYRAQVDDYDLHQSEAVSSKATGPWHAGVFSVHDLIRAAAGDLDLAQYLQPNIVALNAMARKHKQTMQIPGVVAAQKEKKS